MNLRHAILAGILTLAGYSVAGNAFAACSGPSGSAGDMVYAGAAGVMVYCNDTNWVSMAGSVSSTTGTGATTTLQALTDVDVSARANGTYLKYNGTSWVATNPFGTLTNTKWCTYNGTAIDCNTSAPLSAPYGTTGDVQINGGSGALSGDTGKFTPDYTSC